MPTRFDKVYLNVTIAGVDVTANVVDVTSDWGFDLNVSEATVLFKSAPTFVDWGAVVISAGAGVNNISRFKGLAIDNGADYWPNTPKLAARGYLVLAEQMKAPVDAWINNLDRTFTPNPLSIPAAYDPPGIDMSNNGAGQTDDVQVNYILAQAGISAWVQVASDIGGIVNALGTVAVDQFVWKRNQSGLQYIQMLDGMYGFRTYEGLNGWIYRKYITPFAAFQDYTPNALNEGADILAGASIRRDYENVRNRVTQTGFDSGGGGNAIALVGTAVSVAPVPGLLSEDFTNSLIERTYITDAGSGLSCEEAANFQLGELQYPMLEAIVPTWRDDAFEPDQIRYLNSPHLSNVNQAMWVKHVHLSVTANSFTQILTLRAVDYAVRRNPPLLGSMNLPTRLSMVN